MGGAAVALCAALSLVGCAPRAYSLECAGPRQGLSPEECQAVADAVVRAGPRPEHIGDLMGVSVEPVDCDKLARASFERDLAAPDNDGCWGVLLQYEGADLGRSVAHDRITGELSVYP